MNIQNLDILTFPIDQNTREIIFPKDRPFYNKGIKHLILFDSCFNSNGDYSTIQETQLHNIYVDLYDKNKNSIVKRTSAVNFFYIKENPIDLSLQDVDLSISRIIIETGIVTSSNYLICGVVYDDDISINTNPRKIVSFEIKDLPAGEYQLSYFFGDFFNCKNITNIILHTPQYPDTDEFGSLVSFAFNIRSNNRVLDNIPGKMFSYNQYLRGLNLDELQIDPYQSTVRFYSQIYNPFKLTIMYND